MKKYIFVTLIFIILLVVIVAGFKYIPKNGSDKPEEVLLDFPEVNSLELTDDEKTRYQTLLQEYQSDPKDSSKLFQLARFAHIGGNFQKAEEFYLKALEARPNDTLIMSNLGDVYYTLKQFEKSEQMYRNIIQINPKWINAYFDLANIYRYQLPDKYPTILPLIDTGIQIAPENTEDFYILYGIYYRDTGNKEKAIEYYQKVLEINPKSDGAREEIKFLEK